jgi:electron transfer flavoprotein beta subunit
MVTELPWDSNTGTLRRDLAEGVMNQACKHALEAALKLKESYGGHITAISMGPMMAMEVLHEAIAMGADRGVLVCDPVLAGCDTLATSYTLACAIRKACPDFDLVLCGCYTSDSETAQVGPQLAEELGIPGIAWAEYMEVSSRKISVTRQADGFLETFEFEMPGLVTVSTRRYLPRYISFTDIESAFESPQIEVLDAGGIGADPSKSGQAGSPTRILSVRPIKSGKKNIVLQGPAKKVAHELFEMFGERIAGAVDKDMQAIRGDDR